MFRALHIADCLRRARCCWPDASSAQSTFNAHGPAARSIASLSWFMTVLFLVITVIMWLLIGYRVLQAPRLACRARAHRRRRRPDVDCNRRHRDSADRSHDSLRAGLGLLRDFPIHGMHGGSHHAEMAHSMKPEILIIGHQWWWEIHYLNDDPSQQFTTANELHLPVGRSVNIEVGTARCHALILGSRAARQGRPYSRSCRTTSVCEASQPGEYTGQCAEYCGAEHARMRILAVAQEPGRIRSVEAKHSCKPAAEPTTPDAIAGEQIFLAGPCSMCHTVRGTSRRRTRRAGSDPHRQPAR